MPVLLLFAPQPARRDALLEQLALWPDLTVISARTPADLENGLKDKPDAVLLDNDEAADTRPLGDIPHLAIGPHSDMPRPLRWARLAGRLQLLLGRSEAEEEFSVGSYSCLPLERVLLDAEGGEHAKLTDKEVQLLRMLSLAGSEGMGRDDLLSRVWGYREGLDTHTLETHIYRLRQKIEVDPATPRLLLTIEDGYKLAEDV